MNENVQFSKVEDAIAEASSKVHETFAAAEHELLGELAKIWLAAEEQSAVPA